LEFPGKFQWWDNFLANFFVYCHVI
jgi:hypothetical protein